MDTRKQLQELLSEYVVDTLNYIQTVRDFCDKHQIWNIKREKELKMMRDIKDQADKVHHKFTNLKRSKNKVKALGECLKNIVTPESTYKELEKELGDVLENTRQGLEKLHLFLDAVENLAVTSPFVFTEQIFLSEDKSPKSVRSVITAARMSSPLLIHFKRNAETFFLPSLSNLDALCFQLEKYIEITKQICERMKKKKQLQELLSEYVVDTICGAVLENTLEGLEKLDLFLDALENLAVTSPFVFTGQSFLSEDESPECVRSVITAARMSSPLLIHFKRNAETFFLPLLSDLDALCFQLDNYIQITEQICERMEKKSESELWYKDIQRRKKAQPVVKISLNFSEYSMQKMLDHLKLLCKIRMDQDTKLTLIFQEYALHFIGLFSQCHSRMEKFLSDLEEIAVQLDKMKKGASISAVVGSSVGIVGGVLSIVGLVLVPISAGASLGLTIAGVSAGVTSGANSLVTGVTEYEVNLWHGTKTQDIFHQYMEDVEKILNCLDQASSQEHVEGPDEFVIMTGAKLGLCAAALGRGIDALVDGASAVKILKTEEVIATATKAGLQGTQSSRSIPKLAAELPDIGQAAKGTPLALSKSARAGFIGLNALFIGLDVLFICKESISLAKGSKSEASQLIRSRAALWRSELEDWKKIHDSLCIGITSVKKSQEVLKKPFLP